ncbi:MAG: hypothetical protein ACPG4Z_06705 [Chitinophagales bacterium]
MKLSALLLLFTPLFSLAIQQYEIKDALDKNLIALAIEVNEEYTHYSSPFVVKIKNISADDISIHIENGTILEADEESNQNFIVTEQLLVSTPAQQDKTTALHAMCIENHDNAPSKEDTYTLGEKATPQLCQLSQFVEDNQYFEPDAQELMWDIANNKLKDVKINSFRIDDYHQVWAIVKNENSVLEQYSTDEQEIDSITPQALPQKIVEGSFTMNFSRTKNVHIALFNMQNVLVDEIYKNPSTPTGKTTLAYTYNSLEYAEGDYLLKVVLDGKIIMEKPVELSWE